MDHDFSTIEEVTLLATRPAEDGGPIRAVVERLPDGSWDWIVWQEGRGRASCSGISLTREGAIGAADAVADELAFRPPRADATH
jgi:hypothetical protein